MRCVVAYLHISVLLSLHRHARRLRVDRRACVRFGSVSCARVQGPSSSVGWALGSRLFCFTARRCLALPLLSSVTQQNGNQPEHTLRAPPPPPQPLTFAN